MSSEAQIEANRRNSLKSTGPRTPEGRRAVRLNSLWHGAFAADLLLPGEDSESLSEVRRGFQELYHPASDAEEFLVNRLVLAAWRLQRLAALESRIIRVHGERRRSDLEFIREIKEYRQSKTDKPSPPAPEPNAYDLVAGAWIRDAEGPNAIAKLVRYQNLLERSFYRALHELERLRVKPVPQSRL